jgi:hypothetical protein
VCVSHQPRANRTVPRHKLLMAARRCADPARKSLQRLRHGANKALMNKQEIAASHDLEPSSEHFGEAGDGHDAPPKMKAKSVAPPSPFEMGTLTLHTEGVIKGGADELIRAQKEAARLSAKFGEEIEAQWCLMTPWLSQLSRVNRARARYALTWRPRFLATLALSRSQIMASRAAKISHVTARRHRREDPDFEAQCIAAEEHAVELLHDVTFKSALEGDCEPVFWQGIQIGHITKFDNRLRIEMLRAYRPETFKTPGSKVNVNTGNQLFTGGNFIIDRPVMLRLQEMRQESLRKLAEQKAQAREIASNDAAAGGTAPTPPGPPTT